MPFADMPGSGCRVMNWWAGAPPASAWGWIRVRELQTTTDRDLYVRGRAARRRGGPGTSGNAPWACTIRRQAKVCRCMCRIRCMRTSFMMRHICCAALGSRRVEYSMDCESLLRGAFLSAWCDEVKQGTAHGFYVRHAKYRTVTERETAKKEARSAT